MKQILFIVLTLFLIAKKGFYKFALNRYNIISMSFALKKNGLKQTKFLRDKDSQICGHFQILSVSSPNPLALQ